MAQPSQNFMLRSQIASPSKVLQLIMTQATTAAPATAYLLQNSMGTNFTWGRTSEGLYTLTADTLAAVPFGAGTFIKLTIGGTAITCKAIKTSTTVLTFTCYDGATPSVDDLEGTMWLTVEVWDV